MSDTAKPGPGKYSKHTERVLFETGAEFVALIVINGNRGSGFDTASLGLDQIATLPDVLENMAKQIRSMSPKDIARASQIKDV